MIDHAMALLDASADFVAAHQRYFAIAQASGSVLSVIGWTLGFILLVNAWRTKSITGFAGFNFERRDAMRDTAAALRNWNSKSGQPSIDMRQLRTTINRAFEPEVADQLIGRAILWVDDIPSNNELALRALKKLMLDVVQVTSTDAAVTAMNERAFDLVISDMGRGENLRAGYELLELIRASGNPVPFFIFSSDDKPEFRQEAKRRGAQLSTNDMLELIDRIVSTLGKA